MRSWRPARYRFNDGKTCWESRDLSPASARNQNTYYLHDGLGSVTALTDADGNLIGDYNYGAFGDTREFKAKIENRYRYTSREFVEPNLYYYRARHMRPDLGRFMSMDPLKMIDGTNMFGFVGNDPMSFVDPGGCSIVTVVTAGLTIGATAVAANHFRRCIKCLKVFKEYGLEVCSTKCRDKTTWFCTLDGPQPSFEACWYECMYRKLGYDFRIFCLGKWYPGVIPIPGSPSPPGLPGFN